MSDKQAPKKAPPRSAAGAGARRRAKRRENVFRELESVVEDILRIAPAVDEDLARRLRRLERGRSTPRRKRKRKREQDI